MKRFFIFICLLLCSIFSYGQKSGEVLKFLGFPVDGSKEKMIQNIKTKGFTYNAKYDNLTGKFNGCNVNIYVSTNYGKVDRIFVAAYRETDSKSDIIIAYNNLLKQFEKNSKYSTIFMNESIPQNEDIYHEMQFKNKRYDASFYLLPKIDSIEFYKNVEHIFLERHPNESLFTEGEDGEPIVKQEVTEIWFDEMIKKASGHVWFMLFYDFGKYSIGIYYDNLKNRPNGEDL